MTGFPALTENKGSLFFRNISNSLPDYMVPDYTVPDYTVPDHMVPDHMVSDARMPRDKDWNTEVLISP
jgi:hypothetical protein